MFINKPHEKTNLRETKKISVAIRSLNKKLLYLLGTLFGPRYYIYCRDVTFYNILQFCFGTKSMELLRLLML